jgi:uncharacterized membrane protein
VRTRWGTSRVEAFSDGVFAIAITLLVLDLRVPASSQDLLQGILDAWPSYLVYATSFLTIGGIWLAHHGLFARLQQISTSLMRANLILLMAVAFVPYPTRLIAESIHDESAERTAVIFYGTTLLAVSIIAAVMWRIVVLSPDLLRPEFSAADMRALARRAEPNLAFYAGFTVFALLAPRAAAFGYLVVAVLQVARVRGVEAPAAVAAAPPQPSLE